MKISEELQKSLITHLPAGRDSITITQINHVP